MISIRTVYTHKNPPFKDYIDKMVEIGNCCDEVWIYTYFYDTMENHKRHVEALRPIVKDLKEKGMRVVIENAQTMGHSATGIGIEGWERLVGSDGFTATSAYCPVGKNFTAHMTEVMKLYASLEPYAIALDDDFRLDSRWPGYYGCFCDNCIKEFNEKYGTSYTREEVTNAMLTDLDVREKYINHNMDHMVAWAKAMAEAAVSVCKGISICIENCYHGQYLGDNLNPIFKAVYDVTGKPVHIRSGGYFYNDHNPLGVFDKVINNSWPHSILGDFVGIRRPEIENANHLVLGKSIGGTCIESSLNLAYGCNGLNYSIVASGSESLEARAAMLRAFRDHRSYWQGLIDDQVTADGEKTGVAGLRLAYFQDMWKVIVPGDSAEEFMWSNAHKTCSYKDSGREMILKGIPITYEDDFCGAYLLHPDIVSRLSDDNLRFLLTQRVLTDGVALQKLAERGFGDQLPTVSNDGGYGEVYTDHEANGRCAGLCGCMDSYEGPQRQTFTLKPNCVALAHYGNPDRVSSVLITTETGGTWIADGLGLWNKIANGVKRSRTALVAQYLSGDKVPARLESDDRIALIVRAKKDGTFVSATLQNTTVGDSYPVVVAVKADKDAEFVFSSPKREDVACPSEYKNGEHFVHVPELTAWQTGTLRIKK